VLILDKAHFALHPFLIDDLKGFDLAQAIKIKTAAEQQLKLEPHLNSGKTFGFLMTDGLSMKEENTIARLKQAFDKLPIFGGSAGDDLKFEATFVSYCGHEYQNAAVFLLIETDCDIELFRTQHFKPTNRELITTEVDFERRIVKEINGKPATKAFAEINGLDEKHLTPNEFALYPLMIYMADKWYIRSIASANKDGSLNFYCAIDYGLPLNVAQGENMLLNLKTFIQEKTAQFKEIYFSLCCDCILRKVENINKNQVEQFKPIFNSLNAIGFNSYGEQYRGVHFNQTLTGIIVGKKNAQTK
jgi:hypothetical protein